MSVSDGVFVVVCAIIIFRDSELGEKCENKCEFEQFDCISRCEISDTGCLSDCNRENIACSDGK